MSFNYLALTSGNVELGGIPDILQCGNCGLLGLVILLLIFAMVAFCYRLHAMVAKLEQQAINTKAEMMALRTLIRWNIPQKGHSKRHC